MFHANIDPSQWSGNLWIVIGIVLVSVVIGGFIVNWFVDRMVD